MHIKPFITTDMALRRACCLFGLNCHPHCYGYKVKINSKEQIHIMMTAGDHRHSHTHKRMQPCYCIYHAYPTKKGGDNKNGGTDGVQSTHVAALGARLTRKKNNTVCQIQLQMNITMTNDNNIPLFRLVVLFSLL